ncbi:ABC transporter substrate-binding protein [Mesorhizobium sp. A623]
MGLTKKLRVIGEGGTDLVIARAMQQNTPENIWSPGAWYPDAEPFESGAFSKAVYEKYIEMTGDKSPVGLTASMGHRPTLGLLEGIRKAGSTETDAVIAAFKGLTFETLTGPYKIRAEDHQGYGQAVVANLGPSSTEPLFRQQHHILRREHGAGVGNAGRRLQVLRASRAAIAMLRHAALHHEARHFFRLAWRLAASGWGRWASKGWKKPLLTAPA